MDIPTRSHDQGVPFRAPAECLAGVKPEALARIVAAAGDLALVLDREGIVRDFAAASAEFLPPGAESWINAPLAKTVAADSVLKVEEMLREAAEAKPPRWREINHLGADGASVPVRYFVLKAGGAGRMIAIGRDLRVVAQLQQRLLTAQQVLERDYARLRQSEHRFRLLFEMSSQAVLVVDALSGLVLEANPAAESMMDAGGLVGRGFVDLFAEASRADAANAISPAVAPQRRGALALQLPGGTEVQASSSLFRHDRATHVLVWLSGHEPSGAAPDPAREGLLAAVERLPDALVVADDALRIVSVNAAFLEMTQLASSGDAERQPLDRFLGRPGVDLKVLVAGLREHGVVRNFSTVLRSRFGLAEEVEVSAVTAPGERAPYVAFCIRSVARRIDVPLAGDRDLPRSVSQLTGLVGRVSLKEIVRETADRIERLCIETALELTADNRASAAELLGLSRQSFYSKMRRYGLGHFAGEEE